MHDDVMDPGHPPVFVFDTDGRAMVFPNPQAAGGWMEAMDVLDGAYQAAFTLDGREVAISARREAPVTLRVTDVQNLAELRRLLSDSSERMGLALDMSDLQAAANTLLRQEWEQRWPRRPRWAFRLVNGAAPPRV